MDIFGILTMIGGLALFLFGMHIMSEALTKASGSKLKVSLEKMTSSLMKAVLLGTVSTAIIQSSSAATVMTIGFVNSGLMTLRSAIGVIMGANIGTTITAWIVSLAGLEGDGIVIQMLKPTSFSPILALIGVILLFVSKSDRRKNIGTVLVGFAVLMFGMETMISAVEPLKSSPVFFDMMANFSNPWVGVLVGIIVTAAIQSSSASIAILQALAVTGAITNGAALAIVMGQNIGTCITAVISVIGASKNAKRTAVFHVYFNVLGTIILMVLVYGANYIHPFPYLNESASITTIALFHTLHNVLSVLMFMPFTKQLEWLCYLTIPRGEEEKQVHSFVHLDERFLTTPPYAVRLCQEVAVDMLKTTQKGIGLALSALRERDNKNAEKVSELEGIVDQYEDKIGAYLIKLSGHSMYESDSQSCSILHNAIGDFERMSDHSVNLMDSVSEMVEKKLKLSEKAEEEMRVYTGAVADIVERTYLAFKDFDLDLAHTIEPFEEVIDKLTARIKKRHYKRLGNGKCMPQMGYVLQDILTNCERIADHCSNIAIGLIQAGDAEQQPHSYHDSLSDEAKKEFAQMYSDYLQKYELP